MQFSMKKNTSCHLFYQWNHTDTTKNGSFTKKNHLEIANDFDNNCHEPCKEGDKVKCNFKGVDGEDAFHSGIVKRLFEQNGCWKYIVVFSDETVPVDHMQNQLLLQSVN